jgi:starch-binding outer membrane protein, SusD/RagB family
MLYQNKFDAAAAMLENVISSNAFSLVTDFASIFLNTGENGTESVFEIQYSNGSPYYNWGGVTRGQGNHSVQQCGIRGLNGTGAMPYAAGWSTNLPTQNLAAAYAAGDKRKAVTVLDIEAYKAANPSFNITYQVAPYKNTGLYNQKYLPRKGETSGQVELNYTNNYRTIRYADVLLMAAEANIKASSPNTAKAQTYVNLVRRRAFGDNLHDITSTGNALYLAILDERRLELAMEGDRFFDLVRTGQAATRITSFVTGKHELFPIPQAEIDISGITQNAGY